MKKQLIPDKVMLTVMIFTFVAICLIFWFWGAVFHWKT